MALEGGTSGLYRMVVEIPKLGRDKMEVALDEEWNPIRQDVHNGSV